MILVLTALSATAPLAFAQEPGPPELPIEAIHAIWAAAVAIPTALVIAFANCLVGYLSKTPPEQFKLADFLYTILISLTIGVLTMYFGWNYATIQTWFANGFLTWYVWKLATILAKIITKKPLFTLATGPPGA